MKAVVNARPRLILLVILAWCWRRRPGPEVSPEIQVRPDVRGIGAFFNGQDVKISANIPPGPRR